MSTRSLSASSETLVNEPPAVVDIAEKDYNDDKEEEKYEEQYKFKEDGDDIVLPPFTSMSEFYGGPPLPMSNDEDLVSRFEYAPIQEVEPRSPAVILDAQRDEADYEKSTSIPFASDTKKRSRVNKEDVAMDGNNYSNNVNVVADDGSLQLMDL